jgi:hypothetical protein
MNFADEYRALDTAIAEYWRNRMIKIKAARAARGE